MAAKRRYPKGVAKREEILRSSLDVIARNGYTRTSVRELADAVGLSQAGLLHYFDSKEELFMEVLRLRDTVDEAEYDIGGGHAVDALVKIARHNADAPGLVQLYARYSSEATDPEHYAHEAFKNRYELLRAGIARDIADRVEAGTLPKGLDASRLATILLALSDGLQTQWLLDPDLDMSDHIAYLWQVLGTTRPGTVPSADGPSIGPVR